MKADNHMLRWRNISELIIYYNYLRNELREVVSLLHTEETTGDSKIEI